MWFVPTRGRPQRLQKFLDGCVETGMTMPGLIVVDGSDRAEGYDRVRLPPNWTLEIAEVRAEVGGRMDDVLARFPTEAFYSIVNDDVVPETPGWDVELAAEAGAWNVAYPWDTLTGMATQFLVGGDLARAVGSLSLGFLHTMVDRAWMDIGKALGRLRFRKDIRLRHEHWSRNRALRDETYQRMFNGQPTIPHDRGRYTELMTSGEFEALIARLRGIIPECETASTK